MSTDLIQVGITTLASGGIAAITAYVTIVWRLSHRVSQLEEKVNEVVKTAAELKEGQKSGDQTVREEFEKELKHLKTDVMDARDSLKESAAAMDEAKKEILISVSALSTELSNFKIACAENRAKQVTEKRWAEYTREQAAKWEDFNRILGKLEGHLSKMGSTKTSSPNLRAADLARGTRR